MIDKRGTFLSRSFSNMTHFHRTIKPFAATNNEYESRFLISHINHAIHIILSINVSDFPSNLFVAQNSIVSDRSCDSQQLLFFDIKIINK